MNETRKYWIKTLLKIVTPVLSNMAEGRLKATMPVEGKIPDRPAVTHLEALGRTLTGLAPWLEMPSSDIEEETERIHVADMARRAIAHAVDPNSPDYCNFTNNPVDQPLVDAAFLCHGIIRAPHELWKKLDGKTQENLVTALKQTRMIQPGRNNWLLFAAMVEAALYIMTGDCDRTRVGLRVVRPREVVQGRWHLW